MEQQHNEGIEENSILKDAKPTARWPWIVGGVSIFIAVFAIQAGVKYSFGSMAKKAGNVLSQENKTQFHEGAFLPMPIKSASLSEPPLPQVTHVMVENKASEEELLLQRAQLMQKIRMTEMQQKSNQDMLQSSALVQIGTGARSEGATRDESGNLTQNSNTQYLKSISDKPVPEASAAFLGDLRFRILKATVIQGVTESAIDSDLPGIIRGHVTEDVYGEQGDFPLIRNGDKLVGEYRSGDIRAGQTRLFVVWTRLTLQDGTTVNLDSGGSDPLGRAGMTGNVNQHFMARYGSAMLMSMIGAGAATVGVNPNDEYNSATIYRQGVATSFAQTARGELQQTAGIQNTIQPPQGTPITILVNRDISFEDVLTQGNHP